MSVPTDRRLFLPIALAVILLLPTIADAHTPAQDGWDWTCAGGDPTAQFAGSCYGMTQSNPPVHHTDADALFYFEPSVATYGYTSGLTQGYQAWDVMPNGHEFDLIKLSTDDGAANVIVGPNICPAQGAVGCTGFSATQRHINEDSAQIKFDSGLTASLIDDLGAHEFGHYVGLGHSDVSSATMWPILKSGQSTLDAADKRGRCQIYGHSHDFWGGC